MNGDARELVFVDDVVRALFEAHGLHDLEALCTNMVGEVITTARTRTCRRVEVAGRCFYVKSQDLRSKRLPLRKWPSYALRGSPLQREVQSLARLASAGFSVPRLVAHGVRRRRGLPLLAAIVTEAVETHVDLQRWCATAAAEDDDIARACFDAAEQVVFSAHERGLVLFGAKYRNLLVPHTGARSLREFVIIDQPDLRKSRSVRGRNKDMLLLRRDRQSYGRGR